jgi:hypothetical protein
MATRPPINPVQSLEHGFQSGTSEDSAKQRDIGTSGRVQRRYGWSVEPPEPRDAAALFSQGGARPEIPAPGEWLPTQLLRTEHYAIAVLVGADDEALFYGEPNLRFYCYEFQPHEDTWRWRASHGGSMGEIAYGWTRRPERWAKGQAVLHLGHGSGLRPHEPWHGPPLRHAELLLATSVARLDVTTENGTTSIATTGPLPFVMAYSEEPGPMVVTAHDEGGLTLDEWAFPSR